MHSLAPGGPFDAITSVDYTYSYNVYSSLWLMVSAVGSSLVLLFITMVTFGEWKERALFEQHSRRILPMAEEDRLGRPLPQSHRGGSASGGGVQMVIIPRILQSSSTAQPAGVDNGIRHAPVDFEMRVGPSAKGKRHPYDSASDQGRHAQLQDIGKDPSHVNTHASSNMNARLSDSDSNSGSANSASLNSWVSMNTSGSIPSAEGQVGKDSDSVKATPSSPSSTHVRQAPLAAKGSDGVVWQSLWLLPLQTNHTVSSPSATTLRSKPQQY